MRIGPPVVLCFLLFSVFQIFVNPLFLFCFSLFLYGFFVLVRMVLCTFCPLGVYALGIFGFCPLRCSSVTSKGVSQFLRRPVNTLALCIARAISTVPDRRLVPLDVPPELSVVLLFDLH